jgi:peptide/nickel transport system permease protein
VDSKIHLKKNTRQNIPVIALGMVGLFFFTVLFGPFLAPYDPFKTDLNNAIRPPFWEKDGSTRNLLGTDAMGRDILSRLVYGARTSMIVSIFAICICGTIGVLLGLTSGYFGGKIDTIIMRFTDLWMSMPTIITAILIVSVLGPSKKTVIIVVGVTGWVAYARIVRGEVLSLKEAAFVQLARVAGCGHSRLIFFHIFPNTMNTLIILVTLDFGRVIIITATLSFLGLGIQPPSASWGLMLAEGRQYITYAWWMITFPGMAILLAVLGMNLTGDWLRDRLDPKQKLR